MADSTGGTASADSAAGRRTFLKVGAGVVGGLVVGAGIGYLAKGSSTTTSTSTSTETMSGSNTTETMSTTVTSTTTGPESTITSTQTGPGSTITSTATSTSTVSGPESTITSTSTTTTTCSEATSILAQLTGYNNLNPKEAAMVVALAEAIIPSDSNGPGATEAGVSYFIDGQLNSEYGNNGRMYMQAPFALPNQKGPVTMDCTTYPCGTPTFAYCSGFGYQYGLTLADFWKLGLASLEVYSNSAYGADFETLSSANQIKVLQDLAVGKPTNFTDGPSASDFFKEAYMMAWAGFLTDPIYSGNRNMVGWSLIGYNGLNQGNFFNCGYTTQQLMVMSTPVPLKPVSKAMLQALCTESSTSTTTVTTSSPSSYCEGGA